MPRSYHHGFVLTAKPDLIGRRRRTARVRVRMLAVVGAVAGLIGASLAVASPAAALPTGAYWYTELDLAKAWTITKGAGVTVAVIDSGAKASLGDLKGQVLPGLDLTGANPRAQSDRADPGTDFGHGTFMAALIAGTGKGAGIVGVAPQAKILPVDAEPTSAGLDTGLTAQGIRWAVDHGAKVINLSFGGATPCDAATGAAIAYAYRHDVIVVASAGDEPGPVTSPANCPGAIAVGGSDAAFHPWSKTPTGAEVDFAAPAYDYVEENLNGSLSGPTPALSGTSASAALVSGTFALLRAKFPHDTARQIVTRALYNVHNGLGSDHGQRINNQLGYGEILPYYALTDAPPAGARNPIYDRFDKALATSTSASGDASTAPAGDTNAATSTPSGADSSSSHPNAAAGGGNSGSPLTIIIVIVVIIAVVALILVFVRRSRRRVRSAGYGPDSGPPPPPGPGFS